VGKTRRKGRGGGSGPIPLYKRSSSHFDPTERDLGTECLQVGKVRLEIDGQRARALVDNAGEKTHRVGVDWTRIAKRRLHTFCDCARFADGDLCSHVWAVLLALAETGPENQPPGKDRLGVRRDRSSNWEDLGAAESLNRARAVHSAAATSASSRKEPPKKQRKRSGGGRRRRDAPTTWSTQLDSIREEIEEWREKAKESAHGGGAATRFFINTHMSLGMNGLVLDVFTHTPGPGGSSGKTSRASISPAELEQILLPPGTVRDLEEKESIGSSESDALDVALLTDVSSASPPRKRKGRRGKTRMKTPGIRRIKLHRKLYDKVLPHLSAQGALGWWDGRSQNTLQPLWWDSGSAWSLTLHLETVPGGGAQIRGGLARDGESVSLSEPELLLAPDEPAPGAEGFDLVLFAESIGCLDLDHQRDLPWIELLRDEGEISIPRSEIEEALTELLDLPALPRLEMPEELDLAEEGSSPQSRLVFEPSPASALVNPPLVADLSFDYGEIRVSAEDPRSAVVDWDERSVLRRDLDSEHAAVVRLLELGLKPVTVSEGGVQALEIESRDLPGVIEPLLKEGWIVEVQGRSVRPPEPPALRVESGIDWFDLSGNVDFAGDRLELSAILDAVSRGERFIELEDGSQGLLPAAWVETYDSLNKLARSSTEDGLRFLPSQALMVDALLTAMPPADVDAAFARLREKLASFASIKPKKEARGFQGTLRGYQREGLGWLEFLREFGLGGVLADDMGLGKTVQVLALIQAHRTPSKTTKLPSLVVAPRSVVYNWLDEAAHFTPRLKVVEYRGTDRESLREHLSKYDIVVTTYGTLRLDIGFLATVEFDTVILDEAQAIKNPTSQTAKASRLLVARHRLALTGTPIENNLGELGSIFEFLNPGLLGRLPRLEALIGTRVPTRRELEQIAQDMRPFILRRTKEQVLTDLPPKTEQVLLCNMRPPQRELYDKLRAQYQVSLLEQVEEKGVSGSAIQVLEALLRLRQVACHPGLVNPEWDEAGSAKLEALFEQVSEVLSEGHKLLVFSQFTSLLKYVREHLDGKDIPYAYLDGQTRDRGEVVDRFQTDPDCNLFLLSLKAGGVGLNLTAAGYVFLLDPWWNPAVEAQAIDRTHRIGQTQPVFAYKMIARDTVEEKILKLQTSKRKLADAILEGEGQSLRDLTADDLRMLLS
jgi:superfamily II DNA or RNA helicase